MYRCLIAFLIITNYRVLTEDVAQETQHAMCKVITEQIQTSANATITRQLKGVCTTKQMERRFKQLEATLLAEINKIKILLGLNEPIPRIANFDNDPIDPIEKHRFTRDLEINLHNNTLRRINNDNVYVYYWKIDKIRQLLTKTGIHIRSPDLYVLGHQLCLQLYPNYPPSYFAIQLRPTSNFFKKHKFRLIDINDIGNDIISKLIGDINDNKTMFVVSNEILHNDNYLIDNSMIIKLIIYIDS